MGDQFPANESGPAEVDTLPHVNGLSPSSHTWNRTKMNRLTAGRTAVVLCGIDCKERCGGFEPPLTDWKSVVLTVEH